MVENSFTNQSLQRGGGPYTDSPELLVFLYGRGDIGESGHLRKVVSAGLGLSRKMCARSINIELGVVTMDSSQTSQNGCFKLGEDLGF
jgi:hypothetical protein